MWMFVWKANEDTGSSSASFDNFASAWECFSEIKVKNFPDYIMQMDTTITGHAVANEVTVTDFMNAASVM